VGKLQPRWQGTPPRRQQARKALGLDDARWSSWQPMSSRQPDAGPPGLLAEHGRVDHPHGAVLQRAARRSARHPHPPRRAADKGLRWWMLCARCSRACPNTSTDHPRDKVNTYDLVEVADLGLVYTTTVGMEMAMYGVPSSSAGRPTTAGAASPLTRLLGQLFQAARQVLSKPSSYSSAAAGRNRLGICYRFFYEYPAPSLAPGRHVAGLQSTPHRDPRPGRHARLRSHFNYLWEHHRLEDRFQRPQSRSARRRSSAAPVHAENRRSFTTSQPAAKRVRPPLPVRSRKAHELQPGSAA